jgi:preprotein translocase subunit SecD
MLEYPRWKLAIIAIVLFLSALYSLPNLYPKDPAVQVSANRGTVVDAALKSRVEGILKAGGVAWTRSEIEDEKLVVRVGNADLQAKASNLVRPELGTGYTVALNLATNVPEWLQKIGGKPMSLGLDLQGGVHFLMEVDERAAITKRSEGFTDQVRATLREGNINYTNVERDSQGILIQLASADDVNRARSRIATAAPDLQVVAVDGQPAALRASIPGAVIKTIVDQAIEQNMTTLRNRINALGVAEPQVSRQGQSRIVVLIPGLQDPTEAKKLIGATATLEYRAVTAQGSAAYTARDTGRVPPDSRLYFMRDIGPDGKPVPILLNKRTIVTGDQLVAATAFLDSQSTGTPAVSVQLNKAGGDRMFKYTQDNVGKPMAAVYIETIPDVKVVNGQEVRTSRVSEEVINAATVQGVFGSNFQTTGLSSMDEANSLALLLRAGSLAAPMLIVQERIIGPSLGAENVQRGTQAVLYSFLFVLVFFLFYYKMFGLVTNIALLLNLLIVIAFMSAIGATLSLPGLAGIALTVGMSVDANVLINERIREELRLGNTPLSSIAAGYDKAAGTIADANVTALLGGIAMAAFGSGPVKGFGITLIIGILSSMYTAVSVSRGIATLMYGHRRKLTKIAI